MAKNHGSKQQKRIAKQKAKRAARRSALLRRDSKDPAIRLRGAEKWPIVKTLVVRELWDQGIGHVVIVRQEPQRQLVAGFFMLDVYCLGVKDAFWRPGTKQDIQDMIAHLEQVQSLCD